MDITIYPGKLFGSVNAIPSKSQAHRLLICAAFADSPTTLICPETNEDIEATAGCLNALGAGVVRTDRGYLIEPIDTIPHTAILNCGESGSTLRFLLPIVGALGVKATFELSGRLPFRPLSPMWEEMERMGCILCRPTESTILCQGKLIAGIYKIDGSVSSQFITGLLFATSLIKDDSQIIIAGKLESAPYVSMTQKAMELFQISTRNYIVKGNQVYRSPGTVAVEGDWSNGAFFLAAQALGSNIFVENLNQDSPQGDRASAALIPQLRDHLTVSAADIPDLVPILSVVAAANKGAVFTDIGRLRLKESDRVASVISMLNALGIKAEADSSVLHVFPGKFTGGIVDSVNDHRIAMSAAIAATVASGPVSIIGAQCVRKSYPLFWEEFKRLGGNYELHIR